MEEQEEVLRLLAELAIAKENQEKEKKEEGIEEKVPSILSSFDLKGIAEYIEKNKCSKIIVATGAGISTAAGIPDFRTPGSGLYSNLQKFELKRPEDIFHIDFFKEHPEPFHTLAKEMFPTGKHKPTLSHYFIRLLEKKGVLARNYTQNIDTLERLAGVHGDSLVEAHGSFSTISCTKCSKSMDSEVFKEILFRGDIVHCPSCKGLVKPDIVFFGESLPERFGKLVYSDLGGCDLLIVMGTSLKVQPFSRIVDLAPKHIPRLLINLEPAGEADRLAKLLGMGGGMDFSGGKGCRDVFHKATCDDGCQELAKFLGWEEELLELKKKGDEEMEQKWKAEQEKAGLPKTLKSSKV